MDQIKLFEATFQKLSTDKGFMAYYLRQSAVIHRTTEAKIISTLGCSIKEYYQLALCQAPDRKRNDFTERLANIAGYAGVSLIALDQLLKEVAQAEEPATVAASSWLPAFLRRWYRTLVELPAPRFAIGRAGLSLLSLFFFIGVVTAKVSGRTTDFYRGSLVEYKDSVLHLCLADNTHVSQQAF